MVTSAELRCWFFETGLPPGGGQSRVDRYFLSGASLTLAQEMGRQTGFRGEGLVTTRRSLELEPLAPNIEIWCKWRT